MLITKTRKRVSWLCYVSISIVLISLLAGCAGPATVVPATATAAPATATAPPATATAPLATATAPLATATEPPPTPTAAQAPVLQRGSDGCPLSSDVATAFTNQPDAYCLLIPAGFNVEQPAEGILVITGPALDQSMEPVRAMLTIARIGSSGGRPLTEVAQEQWAEAQGEYSITETSLSSDPALVADNLRIGEAAWSVRQVVVIHQNMTYKLTFTPVDQDPNLAKAMPDIQTLWDTVFASLTFLF